MRILVLGGTRFIGPPTVRRLVSLGHTVTVFHRGRTRAALEGVTEILGDRARLEEYAGELRAFAPDVVLDMFLVTERDAQRMMDLFQGYARRVVAISSMDVYRAFGRLIGTEEGPPDPAPMTEDSPLRERLYPYRGQVERLRDYDKILVERVVLGRADLPGTVLRLPMVYGPGDYQHRLYPYVKRMDDGRPFILLDAGTAQWRTTRGYVEDVAEGIARAVLDERAAGRIYNVAELDALSESEWVRAIGAATGWNGRIVVLPADKMPVHLAPVERTDQWLVGDTSRIRRELGYGELVSRGQAIRRTVEWERAHPPEPLDPAQFDYASEDRAVREYAA